MDIEKTKRYYDSLKADDVCQCAFCQNYVRQIKTVYHSLSDYLERIGVDIEKPFETMPLEPYEGSILYLCVQYVVLGGREDFTGTEVDGVRIDLADSHPYLEMNEEFFVIELNEIKLDWKE